VIGADLSVTKGALMIFAIVGALLFLGLLWGGVGHWWRLRWARCAASSLVAV
jgi:hypothetical protein